MTVCCEVNLLNEVLHSSLRSYFPLDMMSFAEAAELLRAEEKLQEAKKPTSAEAELSAGAAKFEQVPETDMQMGTARSITAVMLPSNGGNGAMHMGMEKAVEGDRTLSVSTVWSMHGQQWGQTGENGEGRVPILEGDGTQLLDEDGQFFFKEPGWCMMRDQNGYILWDHDGHLCFDQVDEDQLASQTRLVYRQAPITAAEMDSMVEQNQQLRLELDQSLLAHQIDVEHAQEMMLQKDAQNQSDFRAITAEFEWKQAQWAEE